MCPLVREVRHYILGGTATHTHTHTHTHLYEAPKVVKLLEMESRRMVVGGAGSGELFNGYSFRFTRRRKFWRLAAQQWACPATELDT